MARPKKDAAFQEKMAAYLEAYELDELNDANDLASLREMCQLEVTMEQLQEGLKKVKDPVADSQKVNHLTTSLNRVIQSWTQLQDKLGINRSKRESEKDETPRAYIERIQKMAKLFLEKRLKILKCPNCKQELGKYFFYVNDKAEEGSIYASTHPIEPYIFSISKECWKCGHLVTEDNDGVISEPMMVGEDNE